LWMLKSIDGGSNWSMTQIYQGPTGSDIGNVFPVMAVDRGGNVHVAFSQCDFNSTTGTSSNCSVYLMSSSDQGANWLNPVKVNNSDASGDGRTWFTKQTSGSSALVPPPAPAPAAFGSNYSIGGPGGEPGIKVDSHNCIFIDAPGPASLWKSVNNGASFLPKVN